MSTNVTPTVPGDSDGPREFGEWREVETRGDTGGVLVVGRPLSKDPELLAELIWAEYVGSAMDMATAFDDLKRCMADGSPGIKESAALAVAHARFRLVRPCV